VGMLIGKPAHQWHFS